MEIVHVTSTTIVPMTVYQTTSLPSSNSILPPLAETVATQNVPPEIVHVTSTRVVHVTVYPTTSTYPGEDPVPAATVQSTQEGDVKHTAIPTSSAGADTVTVTSKPGQGILSVNPVTPAGFITITETKTQIETTTVTDRVTETVTATVTRG